VARSILARLFGDPSARLDDRQLSDRRAVLDHVIYEVVPMQSADAAVTELPPGADVTVTCSPVKGIDATLDLAASIQALGHTVTPHLSARMVESRDHFTRIVERLEALEIDSVFAIAGDPSEPHGPYADSSSLIDDLLQRAPFLDHVGFAGYPDGHALIPDEALHEVLHHKQKLLSEAGVEGHVSTQMCFDSDTIRRWLVAERDAGLDLPVHLGVPGVIDRSRLLRTGVRLGVGTSVSFLKKNRRALSRLMTSSSYEPSDVIDGLAGELGALGVDGLHLYTFNQVRPTVAWLAAQP
jgi:methylenetetrahydrofolate reductase (NADPH)